MSAAQIVAALAGFELDAHGARQLAAALRHAEDKRWLSCFGSAPNVVVVYYGVGGSWGVSVANAPSVVDLIARRVAFEAENKNG